jgi:Domain of unknown function (DUF397)
MSASAGQGLCWQKSTRCTNGECVEVAVRGDHVLVRGSRAPDVILMLPRPAWQAFLAGVSSAGA